MNKSMEITKEKRALINRGNKLLKQIRDIECKEKISSEDDRQLKHLYSEFNAIFDSVFEK